MAAFVLDKRKKPLMPCSEKRARLLPAPGRAVVHHRHPFTGCLKDRGGGDVQPVRDKIDPVSETTDVAIVTDADANKPAKILWSVRARSPVDRRLSIARTALARPGGPRFLPRLKPGVQRGRFG